MGNVVMFGVRSILVACAITLSFTSLGNGQQYDAYAAAIAQSMPPSKEVRAVIANAARDILFDPYSVRDTAISNVADFGNGTQGVCVLVNSKNRFGGYTGRQSHAITMSGTILIRQDTNHPLCARPDVKWHTFPELDALRSL